MLFCRHYLTSAWNLSSWLHGTRSSIRLLWIHAQYNFVVVTHITALSVHSLHLWSEFLFDIPNLFLLPEYNRSWFLRKNNPRKDCQGNISAEPIRDCKTLGNILANSTWFWCRCSFYYKQPRMETIRQNLFEGKNRMVSKKLTEWSTRG
jgi:hypothetical protein